MPDETRKPIEEAKVGDRLDMGTFLGIDPRGEGQGENTVNVRILTEQGVRHYTETQGAQVRVQPALRFNDLTDDEAQMLRTLLVDDGETSDDELGELAYDTEAQDVPVAIFHTREVWEQLQIGNVSKGYYDLTGPEYGAREQLTEVALALSLCPLHLRDYAICFDDEDPECAAIRAVHPGHDT